MTATDSNTAVIPPARPLTPRPKLFIALGVVLAAWVGFMIWMYVATVYPIRHGPHAQIDPARARSESQ